MAPCTVLKSPLPSALTVRRVVFSTRRLRFYLGRETPRLFVGDAFELAVGCCQHTRIYQNVIRLSVFEQIVMQLDRRRVSAHDNRIEVKAVSEAADDVELIFIGCWLSARRWRAGFGVGVSRNT